MSKFPPELEPRWQKAIEQAHEQAQQGLEPERIDEIGRSLRQTLAAESASARRPVLWRYLGIAGALAASAAAVLVVVQTQREDRSRPQALAAAEPAVVLLRSGTVTLDAAQQAWSLTTAELPRGGRLALAAGARLDLLLPEGVLLASSGPAALRLSAEAVPHIEQGAAAFAVPPRTRARPFVVRVGSDEVVVTGTRFLVAAQPEGSHVAVSDGQVVVHTPGVAAPAVTVGRGETWGQRPQGEAETRAEALLASVAQGRGVVGASAIGYVSLETEPPGAAVELDGGALGVAPVLVRVIAGAHRLAARGPGLRTWEQEIEVAAGETLRLHARLTADEPKKSPSPRPPPVDLWAVAEGQLRSRDCRKLGAVVAKIERRDPTTESRARARMLLAECDLRRGAKTRALARFMDVAEHFSKASAAEPALFEAAKLVQERGNPKQALQLIGRYQERYPSGVLAEPAQVRRCELLLKLSKLDEAGACLASYRERYPRGGRAAEVLFLLATHARLGERWAEAAALYRDYLAQPRGGAEHHEEALYQRVVTLRKAGLAGADAVAQEYLQRFPEGKYAVELRTSP